MNSRFQHGVTLLELMITIAILGIITSIAIPAYTGYIKTSKKSECYNEIATIQLAQDEFFLERNSFFTGVREAGPDNSLRDNSAGYYVNSFDADDNCSYEVVAGPTSDIATSYVLTASGINDLAGEGIIRTFTRQ